MILLVRKERVIWCGNEDGDNDMTVSCLTSASVENLLVRGRHWDLYYFKRRRCANLPKNSWLFLYFLSPNYFNLLVYSILDTGKMYNIVFMGHARVIPLKSLVIWCYSWFVLFVQCSEFRAAEFGNLRIDYLKNRNILYVEFCCILYLVLTFVFDFPLLSWFLNLEILTHCSLLDVRCSGFSLHSSFVAVFVFVFVVNL